MIIFFWFVAELAWLLWNLQKRFSTGFLGGYASSMAGMLVGALALMALADWFLPFVYNIGFPGFQISSLIWMFLGGHSCWSRWPASKTRRIPPRSSR